LIDLQRNVLLFGGGIDGVEVPMLPSPPSPRPPSTNSLADTKLGSDFPIGLKHGSTDWLWRKGRIRSVQMQSLRVGP